MDSCGPVAGDAVIAASGTPYCSAAWPIWAHAAFIVGGWFSPSSFCLRLVGPKFLFDHRWAPAASPQLLSAVQPHPSKDANDRQRTNRGVLSCGSRHPHRHVPQTLALCTRLHFPFAAACAAPPSRQSPVRSHNQMRRASDASTPGLPFRRKHYIS